MEISARRGGGGGSGGGGGGAGGKWQQNDVRNVTQKSIRRLTCAVALQLRVFSGTELLFG